MTRLTQGYACSGRESYKGGDAWEYLSSLPVENPERNKLSDVVRVAGDRLANRARKYLTLASEYAERERYAKAKREIEPPLEQRLRVLCPVTGGSQSKPKPFESGKNVLPGLEEFAQQVIA